MNWHKLNDILTPGASCVITAHYSLDGDAIGSELALAEFLRQRGLRTTIINQDALPRIYHFLDPDRQVTQYRQSVDDHIRQADLLFLLDISGWSRIGSVAGPAGRSSAITVCIDHHATGDAIADIDLADPRASATGELLYDMINALDGEVTPTIARALFVAIATDTGWFRFANTSPHVLEIIADLTRKGVNPAQLYNQIYEQQRWQRMLLLGKGLSNLHSAAGDRIAWMAFTREMFEETGADREDVEGIVDLLRSIAGVQIVLLFREDPDGMVRVSLRSKNGADVSKVAEQFGGGGHARAAGIRMSAELDAAIRQVVAQAEKALEQHAGAGE